MRLMRYEVSGGCRPAEVEGAKKPRWAAYKDAEAQLADVVETVNGRLGPAVKEAWFDTAKPVVHVRLLYADSSMVSGMLQNGALEREVTNITTRFGHRVARVDTNIGTLATGESPTMTIVLEKVVPPNDGKPKKSAKAKR